MTLCSEPIVVVRDRTGELRAFSNVCRHRGCLVVSGSDNSKTLQCPYHRWTYALSGELLATPGRPHPMQDVANFRQDDYGLVPIRLATWGSFVFVNIDGNAPPLDRWLGDLPSWMDAYNFGSMTTVRHISHVVDCNWKVFLENSMEDYHVPFVHQRQVDPARLPVWTVDAPGDGPYAALYSRDSLLSTSVFPVIPTLVGKPREGLFHLWLQPNLQIVATNTYMSFRQYLPRGPDRFELVCGCVSRSALRPPTVSHRQRPRSSHVPTQSCRKTSQSALRCRQELHHRYVVPAASHSRRQSCIRSGPTCSAVYWRREIGSIVQ